MPQTSCDTSLILLNVLFTAADGADPPDEPGVLVALDLVDDQYVVLGVRIGASIFADLYCEAANPEWHKRVSGRLTFAWWTSRYINDDLILGLGCLIAKTWAEDQRRGEPLLAEVLDR